jgi:uncharacterized protein with PIN domain
MLAYVYSLSGVDFVCATHKSKEDTTEVHLDNNQLLLKQENKIIEKIPLQDAIDCMQCAVCNKKLIK